MNDLFSYNNREIVLRTNNEFHVPRVNTVFKGEDSLRYLGPQIWNMIPDSIKKSSSLSVFKMKIKEWVPNDCPCRLCKEFVHGLGYINSV